MGFYKPVVKYLKMNKIYKIKNKTKKKKHSHFSASCWSLDPWEKNRRFMCMREDESKKQNKTKKTQSIVVEFMCRVVKELETESTIQTIASLALTQKAVRKTNTYLWGEKPWSKMLRLNNPCHIWAPNFKLIATSEQLRYHLVKL